MSLEKKKWGHDELLYDLADFLEKPERMMWCDFPMGSAGSCRPDIFTLNKSFTRPDSRIYEIKVSLSDYRSDITKGKWRKYLNYASSVTFCVPTGLVTKNDLPQGCGLMVRSDKGWRTIKAPTKQVMPDFGRELWLKLLMSGIEQERSNRKMARQYSFDRYKAIKNNFTDEVADVLKGLDMARSRAKYILEDANNKAERIIQTAESRSEKCNEILNEYREVFGSSFLSFESAKHHIERMKKRCDRDEEISRIKREISHAKGQLDRLRSTLSRVVDQPEYQDKGAA